MNKRIMFKNMNSSEVLERFALEKLEKIEHMLESERSPVKIDLVLEGHPTHAHNKVELLVFTPDFKLVAHHEGADFNEEIVRVIDKMLHELRKEKDKRADYKIKDDYYKGA